MKAKYKIVIVNYNKTISIHKLVEQVNEQTLKPTEISIIDNSSNSDLQERLEMSPHFRVKVSHFPENIGYSKACNAGAEGSWDWIVFLNPDIEIKDRLFFEKIIEKTSVLPRVGCVGVAQRNPDGTYEKVARKYPCINAIAGKRIPFLGKLFSESVDEYLNSYPSHYEEAAPPLEVDWLQSSFLLVPKTTWQACGGFDERYFVFMADTEYGRRCKRMGLRSILLRDLQVEADGLRSSAGSLVDIFRKKTIRIHIKDALRYYMSK